MKTWYVTKHVILTLAVEAETEEEAENLSWQTPLEQWENLDTTAMWVESDGSE
jgi:hypothetical protein